MRLLKARWESPIEVKKKVCGIFRNPEGRQTLDGRGARARFAILSMLCFTFLALTPSRGQGQPRVNEPTLSSIYPLGGERGKIVQAEVRGNHLDGAYAVRFDAGDLR